MATSLTGDRLTRPFWRLFSAYSINTLGDEFYVVALPLAMLATGYPQYSTTFVFGTLTAATVVGGFMVGFMADRWRTRRLLVGTYTASAAALAVGAMLVMAGAGGFAVALAVAVLLGFFAAISAAGVDAGIPRTLSGETAVRRGYSLVESSRTVAALAGPALAGLAAMISGLTAVFAINALTFLLAALFMVQLRRGETEDAATLSPGGESMLRMVVEGVASILRNPSLRIGVALSFTLNLALGADQPLFLARLVTEMHLSIFAASLVVTVAGGVSIVAALIFGAIRTPIPARPAMIVASGVTALSAIGVGLTTDVLWSAVSYCLLCASTVYYNISWRTYRQGLVDPSLLGRVSASCRSVAYLAVVVGVALTGTLQAAGAGTGVLFRAGGVLALISTIVVGWSLRGSSGSRPVHTT